MRRNGGLLPLLTTPFAGSILKLILVAGLLAVLLPSSPAQAAVPAEFEDVVVADVNGPTDIDFTPDGRLLVTSKGGQLWVVEDSAIVATPAIDLSSTMCLNGERALGGVAVHPEFASNGYVYLYYTYDKNGTCNESEVDGPVNRLSRFVMTGNTIDPASELVLFDTPPLFRDHHNGGDIAFGPDGFVYVTVGDGGTQRFDWPQDPGRLFGKVVRLTDSGDIPPGNSYTGADSARCNVDGIPPAGSPDGTKCQEIYADGLRNPFRFAIDPNSPTTRFYINDVGQHSYEEISEMTGPGSNFGWPLREGPCVFDAPTSCDPPPAGLTDPVHWYPHGVDGGAVTGGAFVPNGVWPAEYDGVYLYADYVFGKIYQLEPGSPECRTCNPPTSSFNAVEWADISQVVSMSFGPHNGSQSLYYVTREGDGVHRIDYVGSSNRAPIASIAADQTAGPLPLAVQFDGSGSSDPDGDALTYEWDFDGDGTVDSTAVAPLHTYTTAGTFFATLTVDDGNGGSNTDSIRMDPGNSPPVPVILTPTDGTVFGVGEVLHLTGSATDPDEALDDTNLSWEVRQHHAEHFHPFLDPTAGNGIDIVAPEPEDFLAATNSFLEVLLTATDSAGVSTTVARIVQPDTVNLTFDSVPSGLSIELDDFTITTPATVVSWRDHNLNVNAPDQQDSGGTQWNWVSWSDGGAQNHIIPVPASDASYSAAFEEGSPTSLTFGPIHDATVRQDRPDRNLGADEVIEGDASPVKDALLTFDVGGSGGRNVASATLELFVTNSSPDGGTVSLVTDTNWSEDTVTWNTAPPGDGGQVATIGDVDTGMRVSVDVTTGITGDGPVSFRIWSLSANGVDYASKEDASGRGPTLTVEWGDPPGPDTQPPTPPTGLLAVADTPTEIELSWNPSSDNVAVTGYDIYRCDGPPSPWGAPCGDFLLTVGVVTSYEDKSVVPESTYTYEVRGRDAAGNVSTESNASSATTPAPDTLPPSEPMDLVAVANGPTEAQLTWTASTDDVELGGYDIFRDSVLLTSVGPSISYLDTLAVPEATHKYHLVAFDTAGNRSPASDLAEVVMPALPAQDVFTSVADATLRESRPDRNYGDRNAIEADLSSRKDALVRFDVSGLAGATVTAATLRLYVTDSSSVGGDVWLVTDNSWLESTVTWNNAPAGDGGLVGSIGDVSRDTWVELDVSGLVTGDGVISLRISSTSSNGVDYASKEHLSGNAAELVVELG